MSIDSKYFDRIQALIAKAESTEFEGEAEVYRAKAEELIASYGIDRALLEKHRRSDAPEEIITKFFDFGGQPYVLDRIVLLHQIANGFGATGFKTLSQTHRRGFQAYKLYGYESMIEQVEFLFATLSLHMFREGHKAEAPYGVHRTTFLKSFYSAYATRVGERLKEITNRLAGEAEPGTALVLADRSRQVDKFMRENVKIRQSSRRVTRTGTDQGRAAGDRADLGQKRMGGQRVQLTQ